MDPSPFWLAKIRILYPNRAAALYACDLFALWFGFGMRISPPTSMDSHGYVGTNCVPFMFG